MHKANIKSHTKGLEKKHLQRITGCMLIVLSLICPMKAEAFVFPERIALSKGLAHYAMGYIYDLLGLTTNAVFEYEKSSQFDETGYLIHLKLGTDYARVDMLEKAVDELNQVVKYHPENLQSRYLLALIYSDQKKYTKAAEEYEHILNKFSKAEPQNMEIYGYLGQLYYSQRKYDKAIKQFESILTIDSKNPDVMYLLGSLYLEVKKYDQAIDVLKKSLEIDPEHDGSLNTLAYLYAEEGKNLDDALNLVNRALAILPNSGAYLDSKGWILYKKGLYQESLEYLLKADTFINDPTVYAHIGEVYFVLGEKSKAIKYWELSLDLQPEQKDIIEKINKAKSTQAKQVDNSK